MSESISFHNCLIRKGQAIMFEGEKGKVIRVKPLLVIRTENRVICGALEDQLDYTNECIAIRRL